MPWSSRAWRRLWTCAACRLTHRRSPGLFFRKRSADGKFTTDGDANWPKNGFLFKGTEVEKGWVQMTDRPEKWLPIGGKGNTYLWPQ